MRVMMPTMTHSVRRLSSGVAVSFAQRSSAQEPAGGVSRCEPERAPDGALDTAGLAWLIQPIVGARMRAPIRLAVDARATVPNCHA